jgi:hypothetical protein
MAILRRWGQQKEKDMIKEAAIRTDGKTYTGYSHSDALYKMMESGEFAGGHQLSGFMTDDGIFLNREDAYIHAVECGQVVHDHEVDRFLLQSWMLK